MTPTGGVESVSGVGAAGVRRLGAAGAAAPPVGPLQSEAADLVTGLQGSLAALLGYVLLSATAAGLVALAYRWYFRERLPDGVAALVGVSAVAVLLQANEIRLDQLGGGSAEVLALEAVLGNVVAIAAAVAAAPAGLRVGDAAGSNLFSVSAVREFDGDLGRVVRAGGRVRSVTLPEAVADMEAYDPVPDATKAEIAGKTLLFPRGLTTEELRDRLATRLRADYGVGHVDLELTEDGELTHVGLGSRLRGIGPTLAPGTAAVAVRADAPAGASPGDVVQVWRVGDGDPERLCTAELRGTAGDAVTLAVDESDTERLDGRDGRDDYRLVTLPSEPAAGRQFASLLRSADATMGAVPVAGGSPLVGRTVGDTSVTVTAVKPSGGPVEAVPPRSRAIDGGDLLYVVARPDALRRLEREAGSQAEAGDGDESDESDESNAGDGDDGESNTGDESDGDPDGPDRRETQPSTARPEE